MFLLEYLQLAIRSEQICLSRGYNFKFMGHDSVSDILKEKGSISIKKTSNYKHCFAFKIEP